MCHTCAAYFLEASWLARQARSSAADRALGWSASASVAIRKPGSASTLANLSMAACEMRALQSRSKNLPELRPKALNSTPPISTSLPFQNQVFVVQGVGSRAYRIDALPDDQSGHVLLGIANGILSVLVVRTCLQGRGWPQLCSTQHRLPEPHCVRRLRSLEITLRVASQAGG